MNIPIGKALKLIRTAKGIKQKELAKMIGRTPNYVSLIETGKRDPSWGVLYDISLSMGVNTSSLVLLAESINVISGKSSGAVIAALVNSIVGGES